MSRRFLLHLLAYAVPTFLLGYVWHLVLFAGTYQALEIYRTPIIVPFGFAAILIQGAIVALAYPKLTVSPERLRSGLAFASGAALLSWTFTTLTVAAKHRMSSVADFIAIETAFTLVQFLLVGPLLVLASRVWPEYVIRPQAG